MRFFSDSGLTTGAVDFAPGDTVYIGGAITSQYATTGTVVKMRVYDVATDTLQATPLDTTKSFVANTATTLTAINGGTVVSFATTNAWAVGDYYLVLTLGDEAVTVYFELTGAPTTYVWTTTAEFESGTLDNCIATNDNLYAGYAEDWSDSATASFLTKVGTFQADAEGYARWATLAGEERRYIYANEPVTSPSEITIATTKANHYKFYTRTFFGISATNALTTPSASGPGDAVIRVHAATTGISNPCYMQAYYVNAAGTVLYWTGTAWATTGAKNIRTLSNDADATYYRVDFIKTGATTAILKIYNDEDTLVETTTDIDLTNIYRIGESGYRYWFHCGNDTYSNYSKVLGAISTFNLIYNTATWKSSDVTPPTDQKLRQIAFTLSNGDAALNYISKIEIYDADTDTLLDTADGLNVYATGAVNASAFSDKAKETINNQHYFKVYFTNNGDADILTIADITLTFETVAYIRTDGGVFRLT